MYVIREVLNCRHVSNILGKLEMPSRSLPPPTPTITSSSEAAAWRKLPIFRSPTDWVVSPKRPRRPSSHIGPAGTTRSERTKAMAKPHETTTAPAIPRSIQRPVREDVRARLLTGFPVTERRLSLNNLSTAVLEGGDGPPIMLLHGPAAYGAQWRQVIRDLVTTHRVIAPDLPGHGASDSIDRPPDREFIAGWLEVSSNARVRSRQ
jgi:alpha/beta hydrolase fold